MKELGIDEHDIALVMNETDFENIDTKTVSRLLGIGYCHHCPNRSGIFFRIEYKSMLKNCM